jgi:hypothetical protein
MILGKHILKECPEGIITDESRDLIRLFLLCHSVAPSFGGPAITPGPLPAAGGILDQDNRMMEAFEVIGSEMMEAGKKKDV